MKRVLMVLVILILLIPARAIADETAAPHSGEHHSADHHAMPAESARPAHTTGDDAENEPFTPKDFGMPPIHDNEIFAMFKADRFEYQTNEGEELLLWDVQAWIGTDYQRLYLESEGEWLIDEEDLEHADIELLYGFNVSVYWDLRIGLRHDFEPGPSRTFAALGVLGLAPYWFEIDATAYISDDGDISAELEAEYDLLLTQKLVLQPRLETTIALQEVSENGVGQGINDIELGLRLRYELHRKFAPYIGIQWHRKIGETADLAREDGEEINVTSFVTGITFWF
jgi:copper resistance protein B